MHNYYDAGKDFMTIKGPSEAIYEVKRSKDGYVGYKVGIAQVEENSRTPGYGNGYRLQEQELENGEKGKLVFTVNIQSVLSQGSYFLIAELSNETETIVAWGIIDSVNTKGLYQAKYNMFDQDPHKLTKENLIIRPSLTERSLSLMQNAKFPK